VICFSQKAISFVVLAASETEYRTVSGCWPARWHSFALSTGQAVPRLVRLRQLGKLLAKTLRLRPPWRFGRSSAFDPERLTIQRPWQKRPAPPTPTADRCTTDRELAIRKRRPNGDLRTREYLTETEVERLMNAARKNRWGHRDATMVLVAYRHGLRASEVVDLRWEQVDFRTATLHVRRVKQGTPSTHPILGDELRAMRRLQREQEPKSPFVFTSEREAPFGTAGFARMVERAGIEAKLSFKAHPHMLRHACGYALANKGHDTRALQAYLGHRNIQHTVRYTELSPTRFREFWRG
jgi:integrase